MPKQIANLRETLVAEARRQVLESGYSALTVRSVAKKCGVAVGTVYNYFASKDALVAEFMIADWRTCRADIENRKDLATDETAMLKVITERLELFCREHEKLFSDPEAQSSYISVSTGQHTLFRNEIADIIAHFVPELDATLFAARLAAEGIIIAIREQLTPEELYPPLLTLIKTHC